MSDLPAHIRDKIEQAKKTRAKELYLSYQNLTAIPTEVLALTWLETLSLSDNHLTTLPEAIASLSNLTKLALRGNQLTTLPEAIGRLSNLTTLNLHSNHLTTLPDTITRLSKLTTLFLDNNNLTILPEVISHLPNLTELGLSENQLTTLPETIARLLNLTNLGLSFNRLTTLPEAIVHLSNLTKLALRGNQLITLPEAIARLSKLAELDIRQNPLETPPPEIADQGIKAIRLYFHQLKEAGLDHLHEAKLLIIGEPGAGKTSLARKLQRPDAPLPGQDESTEGIDIQRWSFPLPDDNGEFQVNVWDFGGQEIYHATHRFFLTRRSLYVLVADTRADNTDFDYWLNMVGLLSDESPALIVKNEKDDRPRELNERNLRAQFANLREIFAVNLADGRGLAALTDAIKYHLTHLPHVGDALPKTWTAVRAALERDPRNYISLDEYRAICQQNGFTALDAQLQLSGYLHDLGVCLHYQDDPLLKKTIILKPGWCTAAVYRVLDARQVIANLGCFTRADLRKIWHEDDYALMRDELLQMMKKFQLCYEVPGSPGVYIAPQLLADNQPDYPWNDDTNLRLRYTYDFMPKGMLTRFIVAMHPYIWQQKYVWRSGVILNKDDTKAEVIEYYGRRRIEIRLSGQHKRDLMTTVRDELGKIHASYPPLKYEEWMPCNCASCQSTAEPHFYRLRVLRDRLSNQKYDIECDQPPYHRVEILSLIDDIGRREQFLGGRERPGLAEFDEAQGNRELLLIHQRNLQKLKEQAASRGASNVPLDVSNQIEAEEREIQELQEKLQSFYNVR